VLGGEFALHARFFVHRWQDFMRARFVLDESCAEVTFFEVNPDG